METVKPDPAEAAKLLEPALVEDTEVTAETLGNIRYRTIAERAAKRLDAAGAEEQAVTTVKKTIATLSSRIPDESPAKPDVIGALEQTLETIAGTTRKTRPRAKAKA